MISSVRLDATLCDGGGWKGSTKWFDWTCWAIELTTNFSHFFVHSDYHKRIIVGYIREHHYDLWVIYISQLPHYSQTIITVTGGRHESAFNMINQWIQHNIITSSSVEVRGLVNRDNIDEFIIIIIIIIIITGQEATITQPHQLHLHLQVFAWFVSIHHEGMEIPWSIMTLCCRSFNILIIMPLIIIRTSSSSSLSRFHPSSSSTVELSVSTGRQEKK